MLQYRLHLWPPVYDKRKNDHTKVLHPIVNNNSAVKVFYMTSQCWSIKLAQMFYVTCIPVTFGNTSIREYRSQTSVNKSRVCVSAQMQVCTCRMHSGSTWFDWGTCKQVRTCYITARNSHETITSANEYHFMEWRKLSICVRVCLCVCDTHWLPALRRQGWCVLCKQV